MNIKTICYEEEGIGLHTAFILQLQYQLFPGLADLPALQILDFPAPIISEPIP